VLLSCEGGPRESSPRRAERGSARGASLLFAKAAPVDAAARFSFGMRARRPLYSGIARVTSRRAVVRAGRAVPREERALGASAAPAFCRGAPTARPHTLGDARARFARCVRVAGLCSSVLRGVGCRWSKDWGKRENVWHERETRGVSAPERHVAVWEGAREADQPLSTCLQNPSSHASSSPTHTTNTHNSLALCCRCCSNHTH
jgi:hypothetical protein